MRIAFLGDIALIGQYDVNNPDVYNRLEYLKKQLSEYDFCIANLESPFTNKKKTGVCKSMHIKSNPKNIDIIKYLGIDGVSLANNHINDYGNKGLKDCIETLNRNGIEWFGINNRTFNLEDIDTKIRISGFCCYSTKAAKYSDKDKHKGVMLLSEKNITNQLKKDTADGYFSILQFHWGEEHTNYPMTEHVNLIKRLAEEYRFIAIGHHPHVIQGIQEINDSIVAYSLGNCIFDTCVSINGRMKVERNEENKKSFILGVDICGKDINKYEYNGFYDFDNGIKAYDISEEMNRISDEISEINDTVEYEEKRKRQISATLETKFGKHDFRWLIDRLNYRSIGARIIRSVYDNKFAKEFGIYTGGIPMYRFIHMFKYLGSIVKSGLYKCIFRKGIKLGTGSYIDPGAGIEIRGKAFISLGNKVHLKKNTYLSALKGGKIEIGDKSGLNRGCVVVCHNNIHIGSNVEIGPNVCIYDHDHDYKREKETGKKEFNSSPIYIGDNVWIGANVCILRGVTIGDNSVVAAGTVVNKDVPANTIAYRKSEFVTKEIM